MAGRATRWCLLIGCERSVTGLTMADGEKAHCFSAAQSDANGPWRRFLNVRCSVANGGVGELANYESPPKPLRVELLCDLAVVFCGRPPEQSRRARDRWHSPRHEHDNRRRHLPSVERDPVRAEYDRCAVPRRASSDYANNSSTCTSVRQDGARG